MKKIGQLQIEKKLLLSNIQFLMQASAIYGLSKAYPKFKNGSIQVSEKKNIL
jgi:hypothetical protein